MTYKPLVGLCAMLGSALVFACGSNSDKKSDGDTNPDAGETVQVIITEPNDAGIIVNISGDGGEAEMTNEEYTSAVSGACKNGDSVTASSVDSKIELIVDASQSMDSVPDGNSVSKWVATRDAMLEAIVGVNGPGLSANIGVGLLLYPNMAAETAQPGDPMDVTACVNTAARVPMAQLGDAASAQRTAIRQSLSANRTGNGTPTHDAYQFGLDVGLLQDGANVPGDAYMLLITDGEPTRDFGCTEGSASPPIVAAVQAAYDQGVRTFVIGSPGSESAREWLSDAAVAGGTALAGCDKATQNWCHMDMTTAPDFSQALADGLAIVTSQMAACTYEIPAPPAGKSIDLSALRVFLTDPSTGGVTLLYPDTEGDCTVGWQLNAANQIVLCSESCAKAQSVTGARVDLAFGCATTTEFPPPE
jgi:hypothetical protein